MSEAVPYEQLGAEKLFEEISGQKISGLHELHSHNRVITSVHNFEIIYGSLMLLLGFAPLVKLLAVPTTDMLIPAIIFLILCSVVSILSLRDGIKILLRKRHPTAQHAVELLKRIRAHNQYIHECKIDAFSVIKTMKRLNAAFPKFTQDLKEKLVEVEGEGSSLSALLYIYTRCQNEVEYAEREGLAKLDKLFHPEQLKALEPGDVPINPLEQASIELS